MKTGLIVEGGGMKCVYSAAVLDKFIDEDINFDYCIGVSAGSANALSYLAGQRERNMRFYTQHVNRPGYFGLKSFAKTGNLFGLDYIYGEMTNHDGPDPVDYAKIVANPAEYELVVTNALTGTAEYHGKDELQQDNYEWVKASCALPAACRPRIINGVPYYDGGVTDPIPCDRALNQGCDRIVVILSKPRNYEKKPEGFKKFYTQVCRKYPKVVEALDNRHISYMKSYNRAFELEAEGKAFIFAPTEALVTSTYAMDVAENRKMYELGLENFEEQKEALADFLKE